MKRLAFRISIFLLLALACSPLKPQALKTAQLGSTKETENSLSNTNSYLIGEDGLELDSRRCQAFTMIDQAWPSTQQPGDAAHGWVRLQRDWAERNYQDKVTAILAGIEHCGFDPARVTEANGLLRFSMFQRWPSQNGQVWWGTPAWNDADLGRGLRIFFLYSGLLNNDLLTEFDRRMRILAWTRPSLNQTENINLMANTAFHLSAQHADASGDANPQLVREWLIEELHGMLENGFWEFGSNYMGFTYSALFNLADFSEDLEIRRLAWAALDYLQIQQAEFSIGNNFAGPAVRQYVWGATTELRRVQTGIQDIYFGPFRPLTFSGSISDVPAYMIANNYQPLELTGKILADNTHLEVKSTTGSYNGVGTDVGELSIHRQYMFSGSDFALGTFQRFQDEGMAHHNFVNVVVQSRARSNGWVIPWSFPDGHQVAGHNRSFGYKNVAFMQDAGNGYTNSPPLPAKIYAHRSFTTVEIQQCFAFLSDGTTYVAWIPSRGNPVSDGVFGDGFRLRSNVTINNFWGEAAIFEAGDAEMFGSFAAFKQSIQQRVGGCPRWNSNQLRWLTKEGTELVFTNNSARVNGQNQDYSSYTRLQSRHTDGATVTAGGLSVGFDLENGYHTGDLQRLTQSRIFGNRAPYPFLPEPCVASETRLCIGENIRFAVTLDFKRNGVWSAAHMVPIAGGQTGYAWFFNQQTPEVMFKIIDGRAVNGKFWYFHGQLTDLEFRLQVKDSETGVIKTYSNAPGQNRGLADTDALPVATTDNRAGNCTPSENVFCSHNGRFATTVNWHDFQGHTGVGHFGYQDVSSARVWFFGSSNQELIIKVIDGRSLNSHYWVYFGALTNVYYEVHVRDTVTGFEKTYINQSGQQKGIADTHAF